VFAIGNSGSRCSTAGSPGDQPNVISVGATNDKDGVARFSSRGPGAKNKAMKPEVSAPGEKVYSAWNNGGYNTISGTSWFLCLKFFY
jgi:subtilisin family serine protease